MFKCSLSCQCLLYAILCLNVSNNNIDTLHLSFYSYLHISYSEIYSLKSLKSSLIHTKIVQVQNNGIKEICNIIPSRNILLFNLGYNFLKNIKRNCLETLYLLKILCIHNNYITFLERHSFYNLTNLTLSNISNNPLKNMPELFKICSNIDVLYIKNTSFRQVNIKSSNEVNIKFIVTNDYHICCITSLRTLCTAKKPWYISCSDILPNHTIKFFFILIAPLVLFLNVVSIVLHILSWQSNKAYSLIALSININEILCDLYLCCLLIEFLILSIKGKIANLT